MIDLVASAVGLASIIVLAILGIRKTSLLRRLDANAVRAMMDDRVKSDLIAKRLSRKLTTLTRRATGAAAPLWQKAQERYAKFLARVETMEREYRVRAIQQTSGTPNESLARVLSLLEEAQQCVKAGELEKAEQMYIQVISLHPKNTEAFHGLGKLYREKGDVVHAKESLRHAMKLSPGTAALSLDLAQVYEETGQTAKALEQYQRAARIEPNDPKTLDALLDASLRLNKKDLAATTLKKLEVANPENQKIQEFRERLATLR